MSSLNFSLKISSSKKDMQPLPYRVAIPDTGVCINTGQLCSETNSFVDWNSVNSLQFNNSTSGTNHEWNYGQVVTGEEY